MGKASYKITLEGELLEQFLLDLEESERTAPQQIRYYLKQIYKGNLTPNNIQTSTNMAHMGNGVPQGGNEVPPVVNSVTLDNQTDNNIKNNEVPQKGNEGTLGYSKDTLEDIENLMGDF